VVRAISRLGQRPKERKAASTKAGIACTVIFSASVAFVAAGCTGGEQETRENLERQQSFGESEQVEQTEARAEGAERGNAGDGVPDEVVLEIEGTSKTGYSGACAVGDEENAIRGQVPERFVYDLRGRKLECEIRKEDNDTGELKVLLTAPGSHIVQQTSTPGGVIELTYAKNGVSSSGSSSSSANQVASSFSTNSR